MPGPTTEVLNDDLKALREEMHRVELSLIGTIHEVKDSFNQSIEAVRVDVAGLKAEFRFAKWLIGLLLAMTLSGIGGGIWWAGNMNADMRNLNTRFDKIEGRFDKFEAAINKLIEQTKPVPKP